MRNLRLQCDKLHTGIDNYNYNKINEPNNKLTNDRKAPTLNKKVRFTWIIDFVKLNENPYVDQLNAI